MCVGGTDNHRMSSIVISLKFVHGISAVRRVNRVEILYRLQGSEDSCKQSRHMVAEVWCEAVP